MVQTVLSLARGAATGMEHLHSQQPHPLLHRDLKTDNLLPLRLDPPCAPEGEEKN